MLVLGQKCWEYSLTFFYEPCSYFINMESQEEKKNMSQIRGSLAENGYHVAAH